MTKEEIQQLAETAVAAIAHANTLAERRTAAKEAALAAVRGIELALTRVLEHAGIKAFVGLPNLGTGTLYLRGLNLRRQRLDEPLPRPGSATSHTLVLDARGKLVTALFVRTAAGPGLHVMDATDADIDLPIDLKLVADAAPVLLRMHVLGAGERGELAESQEHLADNLSRAVDAWKRGVRIEAVS